MIVVAGCTDRSSTQAGADVFSSPVTAVATGEFSRFFLPIQTPVSDPIIEMDARHATQPKRHEVKASEGASNFVIALIDDIGFGAMELFRGR